MNKKTEQAVPGISPLEYKPSPPEIIRQQGNHLKDEASIYLQQHAYNPIDWYPWGEEAISRARNENKPIFLSIGYSSCHWCHVMEKIVFAQDDIAGFMNEHYICIKVDREERPDLDAVYMEAVQALTGGGGWPMSVFLTPELKPFYGGTFFPYDQFKQLTYQISEIYNNQRDKVEITAAKLSSIVSKNPTISIDAELTAEAIGSLAIKSKNYYDPEWGGFSEQMKFPTPVRWLFLLHYFRKTGDADISDMLTTTLDRMGSGGINDHIAGGFFRYATERTWLIPHFEKMLYDNAQIAGLYLEASTVFNNPNYADIARSTLDFMIRDMSGHEGGFYSSYDADSDGEEGLFYLWSHAEIISIAGDDDGPVLARILGITPQGNFEGKNILTRRVDLSKVADEFNRNESELFESLNKYLPVLRSYRDKRIKPGLDKKIITSWNGLAIAALAQGYSVFGDNKYREAAEKAAFYLQRVHYRPDGGVYRSSYDGKAENEGILDDYAFLAGGLFELYQATGEIKHFKRALDLIRYVQNNFKSEEAGYYMTSINQDTPLGRKIELLDSVRPSGNSAMLQALLMAAAVTGNLSYYDELKHIINSYTNMIERVGLEMAGWLDAALKLNGPYYEVIIAGESNSPDTQKLISVFKDINPAYAILTVVPADGPDQAMAKLMPTTSDKVAIDGLPTAYVCQYGTCRLPVHDPDLLRDQLLEDRQK